jgi:glycoside hydrolase-like protein
VQSKTRAVSCDRGPRSVGAVLLALISVTAQMVALGAATGWAPGLTAANPAKAHMAAALVSGIECARPNAPKVAGCPSTTTQPVAAAGAAAERVVVPTGTSPCPDSGPGASCGSRQPMPEAGTSAVPDGLGACPADPAKPALAAPGSCPAQPSIASSVNGSASSSDPSHTPSTRVTAGGNPPDSNSEPAGSSPAPVAAGALVLTADAKTLAYGATTVLEATSPESMTGTPWAIEIFDRTKSALVGACSESSDCKVAYTGKTGVHEFGAYVVAPTESLPTAGIVLASNTVDVRWLGVGLVVNQPSIVAPGKPITFTAFASEEVSRIGYRIALNDAGSNEQLTFCGHGSTCSMSLVEPASGVHAIFATLEPQAAAVQAGETGVHPSSGSVYGTWLDVHLDATTTVPGSGVVWLTATANANLSDTPWSIYIFNKSGRPIGEPCNATSCSASVTIGPNDDNEFRAVIARSRSTALNAGPLASELRALPITPARLDVQVSSALVKPARILWGVDSCKASTQDPSGSTGLYPQVVWAYGGAPDFWGRYLTTTYNCPGLSPTEISAAHAHHMGILPIYDDFDCSAVQGYQTGKTYAAAAAAQAVSDGIPAGEGLAVDIEPPGDACPGAANVDPAFLQGWHDGITEAHYLPIYYGDATGGSAFQQGWCTLVAAHPEFAWDSYIWSFEPSLLGSYSKAGAPGYSPNFIGCGGYQFGWQFELSAGSTPDVDTDEALSRLPLWYP